MIASAYVRGVQSAKTSACPKHFACNNIEYKRHISDSIISQRALREIYTRGFDVCIKNGNPSVIMTSYNKINGEYAYYNYDLVNIILRKDFGYDGLVITDWWMKDDKSPIFEGLENQAYRIRAGIDVFMPGAPVTEKIPAKVSDELYYAYLNGYITLDEIRCCAKNVIKFCLKWMK